MPDNISIRSFRRKDTGLSSATTLSPRHGSFTSSASISSKAHDVTEDSKSDPKGPLGLNLLNSLSEPLIDFVFVHGLGGGSRKTWSKTSSITHYWPQEWLPKDPVFGDVKTHSYRYNSDWAKGKDNCLNIHHFGKSLLGEMCTSPSLGSTNTPIVFIWHSMGGLVIKKAYILARQDATYHSLAKRFHTIYFLATPHRGSDSATLLKNILQIAYSSRAYITDLERSSGAIQSINDEFRNYSADIELWSFYETQKLDIGIFSTFIVDPDSAILGYREEKQMPMNADHRAICKFEASTDPNYIILRNALASTVQSISRLALKSKEKLRVSQIKDLEKYLGVSETLEDDLITVEDTRKSGTCEWFSSKQSYLKWKDFSLDVPGVLWVNGNPATGKSILAGYTIDQLRNINASCSYFLFKYGDKSKSRLSACPRSLAFQMACTKVEVREILLEMQKDDITFDNDNERTIWRKLFLSGIFQTNFSTHYWVVDALDECVDFASLFDLVLTKLDVSIPLRILIISRETFELKKYFSSLGPHRFQSQRISTADTLPDIKLLVDVRANSFIVKNDGDRVALVEKILKKSQGSFLWTVLVLNELSNTHGKEEINQVLDEVPHDMEPLYQRTLDLMSQATRGKKLAKAILMWAACATRPLSTEELDGALRLDIEDGFVELKESIVALCGQLVTVDIFGKVQMIHETARDFLLNDNLRSEFAINKMEAHTHIARICLKYLTGEEMKPPRTSRRGSASSTTRKRGEFLQYACAAFSYHLAKADPLANDILVLVDKLLKSNILSWIEIIAQTKNLIPLIRTAKNLRTYFNSCTAQRSPLGGEIQTIKGWTTDLIRIAAKFADALITLPSAVYWLILPFCPTESMVYKTATLGRRLSVVGLSNSHWDDRLSCIDFHQGQTSAVCHGDELLAVGLTTGTVALYHAISCQEYKTLSHGEAVRLLQFKSRTDLMVSCGMKTIRIWDNYLATWDLNDDGAQMPVRPWNDSGDHTNIQSRRPPCAISISVSHKMMAIAYSGRAITLWDLEEDAYYGNCGKKLPSGETSTHLVTALVFNPNPAIGLLAASYLDGELVLLDPFNDQDLESFRANCHTLAANPDGRLLAGAAGSGIIEIYEFDTLRLLYRVRSSSFYIKQIVFSRDSLHFADIRGSQCNVWEPAILLRDLVGDDSSESTSSSITEAVSSDTKIKVSAMILHPKGEVVFCGKDDGSVSLYSLKTGSQLSALYRHKSLVRILTTWSQGDVIMSVDVSNAIVAWNLKKLQKEGWAPDKLQFQSRLDCGSSIVEVLVGDAARKFILSTRKSDHLWTIDGLQQDEQIYSDRPEIRKWMQHQHSPLHMVCVEGAAAHIYAWSDWSKVTSVSLTIDMTGMQLKSIIPYTLGHRQVILFELCELDGSVDTQSLHLLHAEDLSIDSIAAKEVASEAVEDGNHAGTISTSHRPVAATILVPILDSQLTALASVMTHVVGLSDAGKLVFLDTRSWVCSVDLGSLDNASVSYSRHFFVPYDWFAGIRDVICALAQGDIVFARNNDVAIVKGGLEYVQNVNVDVEVAESNRNNGLLAVPVNR